MSTLAHSALAPTCQLRLATLDWDVVTTGIALLKHLKQLSRQTRRLNSLNSSLKHMDATRCLNSLKKEQVHRRTRAGACPPIPYPRRGNRRGAEVAEAVAHRQPGEAPRAGKIPFASTQLRR